MVLTPRTRREEELLGSFKAFRGADGRWRWITATTNKFKDREGEIFTEEAHKEAVQYATISGDYPELRLWHTPGSCLGHGDFAEYVDGFVVHSGTFDPGREAVAAALSVAKGLGVSQGYKYRAVDRADKVYDWYRTFEVSILPASRAANAWTSVLVGRKEVALPFSRDKKAFLAQYLGEDEVEELEKRLGLLSKQLEGEGVDFKSLDRCLEGVCGQKDDMAVPPAYGGATTWAAITTHEDEAQVWSQFAALLANIRQSGKPPAEQAKLVVAAAEGLTQRLGKAKTTAGTKASGDRLAPYMADLHRLLGPRKPVNAAGMKEIERLGDPVAPYLADLVLGNVERGG